MSRLGILSIIWGKDLTGFMKLKKINRSWYLRQRPEAGSHRAERAKPYGLFSAPKAG
jgi:hypothetical protein